MISEHDLTGFETATKNTMTTNLPSRFSIAALPCAGFTFVGGVDSSLMIPILTQEELSRFWSQVNKSGDCWEWTKVVSASEYGRFCLYRNGEGRYYRAHRISWVLHNGPIPEGFLICHKCDNPSCINPDHLFLGTDAANVYDMFQKGRHPLRKKAVLTGVPPPPKPSNIKYFSKLTEAQVEQIKTTARPGLFHEIGRRLGVHRTTISCIYHGKSWRHVSPNPAGQEGGR